MDSMLSAIKQRRGGGRQMGMGEEMPAQGASMQEQSAAPDMQGLVASLSPEQKQELLMLLSQPQQGEGIEKGAPSSEETAAINEEMQAGESDAQAGSEQSDEIAKSMLDRNSLEKAEAGTKPRGLGDRAKMYMAKKLKGKGKI